MMVAIEDAGFEIRDCLMWLYGSGFPKSYDISKGIDKFYGAERETAGYKPIAYPDSDCWGVPNKNVVSDFKGWEAVNKRKNEHPGMKGFTAPSTEQAKAWDGWGTALKPAWEPIVLAMKPVEKNFVNNALEYGVAGLNIDGGRIETSEKYIYKKGPGGCKSSKFHYKGRAEKPARR